jgi:DNA-binding IclR family transcriptional regulator
MVEMMSIFRVRGNDREVARVMRELGFDRPTAERHVQQLQDLRQRLEDQRRYRVDRIVSAFGKL